MPELPEVETTRAYVEQFCLGSTIDKCNALEQGGPREGLFDDLVIGEDVTPETLQNSLEGRTIMHIRRRGKQMWFVLDKPPHPLFHFGMTGAFVVKDEKRHSFCFKLGEEWPPRFTKLVLELSNGAHLALTDPRRLARVRLRSEPEAQPPISLLGPDPMTHPLTLGEFTAALSKPTAPIKAVLLAQDRVVSGVGNWMSDEVCFQAGIHPAAACNTLSSDQVAALLGKLLSVCRDACAAEADYKIFPEDWLFHHRWGKGKAANGVARISSGDRIQFDVVAGRTTAIVPTRQRMGRLHRNAAHKPRGKANSRGYAVSASASRSHEAHAKPGGVDVAADHDCDNSGTGEIGTGRLAANAYTDDTDEKMAFKRKDRVNKVKPEEAKGKAATRKHASDVKNGSTAFPSQRRTVVRISVKSEELVVGAKPSTINGKEVTHSTDSNGSRTDETKAEALSKRKRPPHGRSQPSRGGHGGDGRSPSAADRRVDEVAPQMENVRGKRAKAVGLPRKVVKREKYDVARLSGGGSKTIATRRSSRLSGQRSIRGVGSV